MAVVAVISILIAISVPVYHHVRERTERQVLEYNTKILSRVLLIYLDEQREGGSVERQMVRGLMSAPIGDPENPLYGRIDGAELDETWFTYVNVSYQSEDYGKFRIEWKNYEAEYSPGKPIKIKQKNKK